MNFQTNNIFLIVGNEPHACTFVQYLLGLSKHFYLGECANYNRLISNPDNYKSRLAFVNGRLPHPEFYDLRPPDFFGSIMEWYGDVVDSSINASQPTQYSAEFSKLTESKFKFAIAVNAQSMAVINFEKIWTNCKVIRLANMNEYQKQISKSVFTTRSLDEYNGYESESQYNQLKGRSWPSWEEFSASNYTDTKGLMEMGAVYRWNRVVSPIHTIDIDNNLFDEKKFCTEIESLYRFADLDDFNSASVLSYYKNFINILNKKQ
jgi:hypothetical protein